MKKNFTLIRLIVKNKNNEYKLCLFKKYTLKDNLYKDFNSKFDNYGKNLFYNIGLEMKTVMINGGTDDATTDVKMEVDDEKTKNENTNEDENEILKILEFPDGEAYFYYIDDETGQGFEYGNLYSFLKFDIRKILYDDDLIEYFDDFYNILLYYFYFENEVSYGDELKKIIYELILTDQIIDRKTIEQEQEKEKQKKTDTLGKSVDLQYYRSLPKNKRKIEPEPERVELAEINKNQRVEVLAGGFKKNKTNKKKQIKKTKKNLTKQGIFYTSLAKKNKQTKKKNKKTKKKNKQTKKTYEV
jgi:hypothetical protein